MKKIILIIFVFSFILIMGCSGNGISDYTCKLKGGKVMSGIDTNMTCPEGMEFLGVVNNVECICVCCK